MVFLSVGLFVRRAVGARVGMRVGEKVGEIVGLAEGRMVGALVGIAVGVLVGLTVGATVGLGVGGATGGAVPFTTVGKAVLVGAIVDGRRNRGRLHGWGSTCFRRVGGGEVGRRGSLLIWEHYHVGS